MKLPMHHFCFPLHRQTRFLLLLMLCIALSGPLSADEAPHIPINLFEPAPGPANLLATESPEIGENRKPTIGLFGYYQHRPFVTFACDADNQCGDDINISQVQGTIDNVKSVMAADLLLSVNFLRRFQVGLGIPVIIRQTGYHPVVVLDSVSGARWLEANDSHRYTAWGVIGDLRLHLKARILGQEGKDGFALAAAIIPAIPMSRWTGQGKGYSGSEFITLTAPRIMASYRSGPFRVLANAGFKARRKAEYYSAEYGHAITYAAGVGYHLDTKPNQFSIEFFAELYGEKNLVSNSFRNLDSAPLLYNGGARFHIGEFTVSAGAGGGIISGIGVPQVQGIVGVHWTPRTKPAERGEFSDCPDWDWDCDGIPNELDLCPHEPEDFDGFEDEDGCPDPDNDGDGIPDEYDLCPNSPEDIDGYRDDDGCPDPDNDMDGIPDEHDFCPDEAEDYDGFEDEDGCPEPDNDGDGIPNAEDLCPNHPEDFDGFEDGDGCPDYDNDMDGVPDDMDQCPDVPGTLNGIDDHTGCPDGKPALVTIEDETFVLQEPIQFRRKSEVVRIGTAQRTMLEIMVRVLQWNPMLKLSIEAHTDSDGNANRNQELTVKRAAFLKNQMMTINERTPAAITLSEDRIQLVGHGSEHPVARDTTSAGRAQNNRIVFRILLPFAQELARRDADSDEMDFTMEFEEEEGVMDFTMEFEEEGVMDFTN